MTRGQGWRFLDMGRQARTRPADRRACSAAPWSPCAGPKPPLLEALLEIADSSMTYRRRYMSRLQTAPVLDLLLADEDNPRSLAYQLAALPTSIDACPERAACPAASEASG